eukprot:GEZU01035740.1.p1 GENE.GEZU01035740.1~~GEZU01035740.1.p1  ORF type:complete len:133 (-),score=31.19 GEZU01035740.1:26-424(-)
MNSQGSRNMLSTTSTGNIKSFTTTNKAQSSTTTTTVHGSTPQPAVIQVRREATSTQDKAPKIVAATDEEERELNEKGFEDEYEDYGFDEEEIMNKNARGVSGGGGGVYSSKHVRAVINRAGPSASPSSSSKQ